MSKEDSKKWRSKSRKKKIIESHLKELWTIQNIVTSRKQQLTDEGNFARMSMKKFNQTNDNAKMIIQKTCKCLSKCLPVF